jgi:hypothetical protein
MCGLETCVGGLRPQCNWVISQEPGCKLPHPFRSTLRPTIGCIEGSAQDAPCLSLNKAACMSPQCEGRPKVAPPTTLRMHGAVTSEAPSRETECRMSLTNRRLLFAAPRRVAECNVPWTRTLRPQRIPTGTVGMPGRERASEAHWQQGTGPSLARARPWLSLLRTALGAAHEPLRLNQPALPLPPRWTCRRPASRRSNLGRF